MKSLVCLLLLLETFVFVDGGQNPPQTDTLRDEASTSHLGIPDIYATLRELTATVTEQKENIRELTTTVTEQKENIRELTTTVTEQKENITQLRDEIQKKTDGREIAFSASLIESGAGLVLLPLT